MIDLEKNQIDKIVSREAEKSVLSCIMQEWKNIVVVAQQLTPIDFYVENYKEIYTVMLDLAKQGSEASIVSIKEGLISKGRKDNIVDMDYLKEIAIFVANPLQLQSYIDIVKEKSTMRKTMQVCNQIICDCQKTDKPIRNIIDDAQISFFELTKENNQNEYKNVQRIVPDVLINIGDKAKYKDGITGVRTYYKKLDKITSGFQNGNMIILAARPSVGKTAFALNLASQMSANGTKIAFFSLEMTKEELVTRMLSMKSKIPSEKLRASFYLTQKEWDDLFVASSVLPKDYFIDDSSGLSIPEMRNKCMRIKEESGLDIVFLDYIQLMDKAFPDEKRDNKNRQQQVSEISRNIKKMAKTLNVPIVALAQTVRPPKDGNEKKDKRPQLEDLKESGALEQDADIVMFLDRPYKDIEDSPKKDEALLYIAKHRNGSTGVVYFKFDGTTTSFYELEDIAQS